MCYRTLGRKPDLLAPLVPLTADKNQARLIRRGLRKALADGLDQDQAIAALGNL